jgi:non-specific serine/threonine protein kinase
VELEARLAGRLTEAFARGAGHGLLALATDELAAPLPASIAYWRAFGARYVASVCARDEAASREPAAIAPPFEDELVSIAAGAPPFAGSEYLAAPVLADFWREIDTAFALELTQAGLQIQDFLKSRNQAWNLVGRVHFNLAENRKDEAAPFAFLATYTTGLSASGAPQHAQLGRALQDYAGAGNRERLLSLLAPVQRAAEACAWLKDMVDRGDIYHPLRWHPQEAMQMLRDVGLLERAGLVVRMPASWPMNRPARPRVSITVGAKAPAHVSLDSMLDFDMGVTLEGESLTPAEIEHLLSHSNGLALIRGKWVEMDRERLANTLEKFQAIERRAAADGVSFAEAMRLLAGAGVGADGADSGAIADWSGICAGPWLAETLAAMRRPGSGQDGESGLDPGPALKARLRPYQRAGVQWLHLLSALRLGACLADDMGLGKTIQVLSLLLLAKAEAQSAQDRRSSVLVAPASLLANWAAEIARFTPSLEARIAHPSAMPVEEWKRLDAKFVADCDLVITTYGMLRRLPVLTEAKWRFAVLDEAQVIKNPAANQTRAVKRLDAQSRIALTGTPIENRLGDLWSIFDFLNPGLLGSAKEFGAFAKKLSDAPDASYAPLRELVRPYILRRLKTDRSVIADLPDKTEIKTFCSLSRKQAALYQQAVTGLEHQLEGLDGIDRRGLVLAFLMRLKQICNHPSQWLGDGDWREADSGKFARLREIAEEIAARQEKALVFTQFKQIAGHLASFLSGIFARPGLILTGETSVAKRKDLVRRFQEDEDAPFLVLSVKAGGAGLNLTAASHVVHFDRWWNAAVENQATDRAFRIGQTRNVLVHKFVCRGTVEERIDRMIEEKAQLAGDLLGGGEPALTEMKDEDLLRLVALDLKAAMQEA